ncbi:MAG: hypothetical protein Q9181_003304 [Wetmoreana brouardii]
MLQLSYLLPLGVAIVVLRIVFYTITEKRKNASAKRLGCQPAPHINPEEIFGFGLLRSMINAFAERKVPDLYVQRLDMAGKNVHTVQAKLVASQPLITRDEKNIKAVLSAQIGDWQLGALRKNVFQKFTGDNVFTLEGQRWKQSRSIIHSAFSRASVSNLGIYEQHTQDFFLNLPMESNGWTKVLDLQANIFNLTIDIITELIYGYSVHTQNSQKRSQLAAKLGTTDLPDAQGFLNTRKRIAEYVGFTAIFGKWHNFVPSLEYYRIRGYIRKYPDWYVRRRLDQMSSSKAALEPASDERFILLHELSRLTQDPIQLRNETMGLLAAGQNPTAALISWVVYHLARNPRVFNKLRDTILSDFGNDMDLNRTGFAELRSCKYLRFCVNEALRVGSPSPSTTREALNDTTLPTGGGPDGKSPVFVPKGTTIVLNFFAMHHRSDLWGEDVQEYKPERWEDRKINWGFTPFGGGPRICAGGKPSPFVYSRGFQLNAIAYSPPFHRTIGSHRDLLHHHSAGSAL